MEQDTPQVTVAIIGAGFAGIGMAIRLRQEGEHDFVLLERSDLIGGTWRDNSYPGCAVDVESHLYSLSFAANPNWTQLYSPQAEIFGRCSRRRPVRRGSFRANAARPWTQAVYGSPFGNDVLLGFADEVLQKERLGQRQATDLLAVSFSSNDSVGHTFGPDSPQVRDIAVRTDRTIGQLLNRVDKLVGLQHTLVAFTTDHGVAPLPESLEDRRLPGGRMTTAELFGPIERALSTRFGAGKWLMATAGSSPDLNYELIDTLHLDPSEVRRVAAAAAAGVPHVARVYTRDQLLRGEVQNDRVGSRVLRGFNAQRSGDLEIILEPTGSGRRRARPTALPITTTPTFRSS